MTSRRRHGQRRQDAEAYLGKVVRWRPSRDRPDPEAYVLCVALEVVYRFGWWDVVCLPIAGGAAFQANLTTLEMASPDEQSIEPHVLLDNLDRRLARQKAAPDGADPESGSGSDEPDAGDEDAHGA